MESNASHNDVETKETISEIISDQVGDMFILANYVIISGIFSWFGIGSNIANIVVFLKQGFKESINVSLMSLAISDLTSLVIMLWFGLAKGNVFAGLDLPIMFGDITHLTGGWPHECFNRITSFITAFITLERCLCIALPLKVKNILTPFRTKLINIFIYSSIIILFIPVYFVNKFEWIFNLSWNRTVFGVTQTYNRAIVESVTIFIHSVVLCPILLISVTVCTIILIVKLENKTKWRERSVAQTKNTSETVSTKEKKVIKMVTTLSIMYVICFVPSTAGFLMMATFPGFQHDGEYENVFNAFWSVAFTLETINSSVNIFIYFTMSSKFKVTFIEVFYVCRRRTRDTGMRARRPPGAQTLQEPKIDF